MLGNSNKEYLEKIISLKQQLSNATEDEEKLEIYETIHNCYARMGLLLEAEKALFEYIGVLRKTQPKGKVVNIELRLSRLFVDNGKMEQAVEHLNYCLGLCDFKDVEDKEDYLGALMDLYYSLSQRDEKFKAQYNSALQRYEAEVKPATTLEKLNYYVALSSAYLKKSETREKGLAYKNILSDTLKKSTELSDAYRERYENYLNQLNASALQSDPDPQNLIKHANAVLAKNKKEKFLPSAAVFYWQRNLANAYKNANDIIGLKATFDELYFAINNYVEENIEAKLYEQKYQSDYFLQEQKLKDAEALNVVKDSVFSNFNHELRTPLNIILSNCELLEREMPMPASGQRRLAAIQHQSYNLLNIIDQFIEVNKTNLQFNQVNNEMGDLVQFLQTMETDFATLCEYKGIKLSLDVDGVKRLLCRLDFAKLERILYNLITNAIKFTGSGGNVAIRLVLDKKLSSFALSVTDTGIGIAEKDIKTIFEQFYSPRDDRENIKTSKGFGIGLYLVRQLVTLLGGTVNVTSKLYKGSAFTIELPFEACKGKPKASTVGRKLNYKHIGPKHIGVSEANHKTVEVNDTKPLLLIAEDNEDLLEIITASLDPKFTIKTASDGKEASKILQSFIPDLVITDLMMPRMNGIELTSFIKGEPALSHLPVIMLTAKGSLPNRIKGWEAGIDIFLRKPFAIAELEHCIKNMMQTRDKSKRRIEEMLGDVSGKKKKIETAAEKFVNDFKSYVLSNINVAEIRNADIARQLHVDENSMYRKIKALTGMPPVQLVTKLKILKAKEFIEARQFNSLKEVAYKCGFSDPKYFSQVYKAQIGALPKIVKS